MYSRPESVQRYVYLPQYVVNAQQPSRPARIVTGQMPTGTVSGSSMTSSSLSYGSQKGYRVYTSYTTAPGENMKELDNKGVESSTHSKDSKDSKKSDVKREGESMNSLPQSKVNMSFMFPLFFFPCFFLQLCHAL